jgi:hypothetical protein
MRRSRVMMAVVLLGALPACQGPDGPAGAAGVTAEAGAQGATGAAGPAGAVGPIGSFDAGGLDLASIPVGCLSPCHGFNGVVTQYQTSAHYIAYVQNLGTATATEWTATGGACGNCHAIDGLAQRVAGTVGTTDGGVVANLSTGELQFRDPATGALSTSSYLGSALTAEVYCTTCHAVTDATDPHKTGIPWTPGSFPLQVSASGSAINIEKSPSSSAVTGNQAMGPDGGDFGAGSTCMWCHRSRVDVTNYLTDTGNVITSEHWGPHEGPQADIFTGTGGYQYANETYGEATHEQKLSCIDCHMVSVADNSGVADHSFAPRLSACVGCHAGATSFDVNGFESQVKSALTQIETFLNDAGLLTRAAAAPYTPLTVAQLGDGLWATDQPTPKGTLGGALLNRDQAGALYNYILIARGGAYGVHNPKYVGELLADSYTALSGLPLAAFPTRP